MFVVFACPEVVQFQGAQPKGHKCWLALHTEGHWQDVCCYIPFVWKFQLPHPGETFFFCMCLFSEVPGRPVLRPAISNKTQ